MLFSSSLNIFPPMFLILSLLTLLINSQIKQHLVDNDKISMFPDKSKYNSPIYAGYLNILPGQKQLYYFFFYSQSNPKTDPVVLWLNGGPGCSSLMGMVSEHGPFMFTPGTTEMYVNPYSWNKNANVIYLQSPGNVGFSYASKKYIVTNDSQTAKDNLAALRYFFQNYKIFQSNDFYLSGQSYAGIYIPMLARQILQFNQGDQQLRINLRGMLLGNPCTHPLQCYTAKFYPRFFTQFLYTHGFLDQSVYNEYNQQCLIDQMSNNCIALQYKDLDYTIQPQATYNILPILVKAGLKIIYYSGDQDAIVPLEGTKWWFQQYRSQFGAAVKKSWRPWVIKSQDISGMVWQLEGLTLATVIGAGHMVPSDKPVEAKQIFDIFLGLTDWKQPDYFEE